MTVGRLPRRASLVLAALWGLPAVIVFSGCGIQREYVRRGQLLDSVAVRVDRLETANADQQEELRKLRADALTELEGVGRQQAELAAQLNDFSDRLDRISRKLGLGRGDITPVPAESAPAPDTTRPRLDTVGAGEDKLYNTAYLDFTRSKYEVAITEFRQYLTRFPNSENADNAQYWIGECYYSLGKYDDAEREFKLVAARYPDGNKLSAAMYKLGMVYVAVKRLPEARSQFKRVIQQYPGTHEADLSQERLRSLE